MSIIRRPHRYVLRDACYTQIKITHEKILFWLDEFPLRESRTLTESISTRFIRLFLLTGHLNIYVIFWGFSVVVHLEFFVLRCKNPSKDRSALDRWTQLSSHNRHFLFTFYVANCCTDHHTCINVCRQHLLNTIPNSKFQRNPIKFTTKRCFWWEQRNSTPDDDECTKLYVCFYSALVSQFPRDWMKLVNDKKMLCVYVYSLTIDNFTLISNNNFLLQDASYLLQPTHSRAICSTNDSVSARSK